MVNVKRVIAIVGVVILVAMYLVTLVLAIASPDNAMEMFYASVYASIVIPVLIWAMTFIYSSAQKRTKNIEEEMKINSEIGKRANMKASSYKNKSKTETTEQ